MGHLRKLNSFCDEECSIVHCNFALFCTLTCRFIANLVDKNVAVASIIFNCAVNEKMYATHFYFLSIGLTKNSSFIASLR